MGDFKKIYERVRTTFIQTCTQNENFTNQDGKLPKISYKTSEAVSWRCSVKNVFLKISQSSQENTCGRLSYLIKIQASAQILWHRYFPVNFAKFLRTPFFIEYLRQLLLKTSHKNPSLIDFLFVNYILCPKLYMLAHKTFQKCTLFL